MKNLNIFLTVVSLFSTMAGAMTSSQQSDDVKIKEIMDGQRINCRSFEPGLTPTLNFETVNPKVLVNATATQISLQMKVVYYRCQKGSLGENTFAVVDPKTPFQYDVEQFDGTVSTVKVNGQQNRFSLVLGNDATTDIKKGIPARVETDGLIHHVRFDIPLEKLLSPAKLAQLRAGAQVPLVLKAISALSTDYRIGTQTQGDTGFTPGTALIWEIKLSMPNKALKAEIVKMRSNML